METIWKKNVTLENIRYFTKNTIVAHMGIDFIEIGQNHLSATMPVDERTRQPLGILHGGASVVLAETLGSMASHLTMDENHYTVGLEIKANHVRSVENGRVTGTVEPVHLGKTTQIWDITIKNEQDQLVCTSRLTLIVLEGRVTALSPGF